MKGKTAAVIGAGPSGLTTAKSLLAQGIQPTIFERRKAVGGLWSPAPGSVMLNPRMRTNLSRYNCAFPDLAYAPGVPVLPSATEVREYLDAYRKRCIPGECLRLGCAVTRVTRVDKGWNVGWRMENGEEEGEEEYDFLVICSGFFSTPYVPPIPMDGFSGSVLHSTDYTWPHKKLSAKKKIVVVGGSLSGVEAAADLALRISSLPEEERKGIEIVHLSPRPFWVIPRLLPIPHADDPSAPQFVPEDFVLFDVNNRRKNPVSKEASQEERYLADNTSISHISGGRQEDYHPNLYVTDKYMRQKPWLTMSESYLGFVGSGAITPVIGRLVSADGNTLQTSAGEIKAVDAVVLATGFHPNTALQNFLAPELFRDLTGSTTTSAPEDPSVLPMLLYKQCLHPSFHNTGGFVGLCNASFFGVMELQGRWLAGLLSAAIPWPSTEEMHIGISEAREGRALRVAALTSETRSQTITGDYMPATDDLRTMLGLSLDPEPNELSPNPLITAHFSPDHPEARKTLRELHDILTSRDGRGNGMLGAAIFKALHGKWAVRRKIVSKRADFPSGVFVGSAEFLPRAPTFSYSSSPFPATASAEEDSPTSTNLIVTDNPPVGVASGDVLEYLYTESGEFASSTTHMTVAARRAYIYRYDPGRDEISVWFVRTDDGTLVDYFFHRVEITGRAGDAGGGGWVGAGKHLCGQDWYWPRYRFRFGGGGRLSGFEIGYEVKGPEKDYDSDGIYECGKSLPDTEQLAHISAP